MENKNKPRKHTAYKFRFAPVKIFTIAMVGALLFSAGWYAGYYSGPAPSQITALEYGNDVFLPEEENNYSLTKSLRSSGIIDFSSVVFTPWDAAAAAEKTGAREKKPYTVMIYMNGSDLESEMGAATNDIVQIQQSGVDTNIVNVILLTGGANRWKNDVVSPRSCTVWEISGGTLEKVLDIGLVNMGDPGTLAGFIDFTMSSCPADKYGLIMWDHGGGSVAGFGDDEIFSHDYLSLLDMNCAFERSALSGEKLEFLGFDSCLMATAEMAVVASDYAKYLIASQDIEPYDGWDYSFLSVFNENPLINGAQVGKAVTDSFMRYYGSNFRQGLAMSVADLSKAGRLMDALGSLMRQCSDEMLADSGISFRTLAASRSRTKTFGLGSPRDNESDMVDIGDMARRLTVYFPEEAAAVLSALDDCVIYNRHNSDVDLKGLSVFYIYGGRDIGSMSLDTYSSLHMNPDYTQYLNKFYRLLKENRESYHGRSNSRSGQDAFTDDELAGSELTIWRRQDGSPEKFVMAGTAEITGSGQTNQSLESLWPRINGINVCLYKILCTQNSTLYAVPAAINGKDCDIIIALCDEEPTGEILGFRREDGLIIQKGLDQIETGDRIELYHRLMDNGDVSGWHKSGEFTANGELALEWLPLENGEFYSSIRSFDIHLNERFSELLEK